MRAMIRAVPDATPPAPSSGPTMPWAGWRRALLWIGTALCLFGTWHHGLWQQWAPGRTLELLVFTLAALLLAWTLRRGARCSWATALLLAWLLALVVFAGPVAVLSTVILAIAATVAGAALLPRLPLAAQAAVGLVLVGTLMSWLLPVPLHYRWVYLGAFAVLLLVQRDRLRALGTATRSAWTEAINACPRAAALAIMVLGLASTGAWLPTLQVDDVGYHLRLPWQLLEHARYPLEAQTHMWALSPWLGDVLQATPQVVGGVEARGPVNLLWIAITAAGVWRLAALLQVAARGRWLAVALYASLPLTAVLAASMQTETPTAALLVWLVWAIARDWNEDPRAWRCVALLAAGLLALKLAAAAAALALLAWAAWRHRRRLLAHRTHTLATGLIALALGSSSYAYAWWSTGNPFLPLFNAWFASPYYPLTNFGDARWHAGFGPLLPWRMTFDSARYLEGYAGAAGFMMVALAGAWVLALLDRRTLVVALVATALLALPLVAMQYLRYAFPALVVLAPVLVAATLRADRSRGPTLLLGLVVLNLVFQANGHWMLRTGAVKLTVLTAGNDSPLFLQYAPERLLAGMIRGQPDARGNVLALDPAHPASAELGARARTTSWYDPSLHAEAAQADADATGRAWAALLEREQVAEVLLRPGSLLPAQRTGLALRGAQLRVETGEAQWWTLAPAGNEP